MFQHEKVFGFFQLDLKLFQIQVSLTQQNRNPNISAKRGSSYKDIYFSRMITVLSCPYREILLDLPIVSKIRQWHCHLNRQLREFSFMKVQWWGMRKMEALCLVSHPWLPWVNPAVIQGILKNSVENVGNEIRKQRTIDVHKFSNRPRESSTNLTHYIKIRSHCTSSEPISPLMSSSWGEAARLSGSSEPMLRSLSDSLSSSECIAGPEEGEDAAFSTQKLQLSYAMRNQVSQGLPNQVSNYLSLQGSFYLQVQLIIFAAEGTLQLALG